MKLPERITKHAPAAKAAAAAIVRAAIWLVGSAASWLFGSLAAGSVLMVSAVNEMAGPSWAKLVAAVLFFVLAVIVGRGMTRG